MNNKKVYLSLLRKTGKFMLILSVVLMVSILVIVLFLLIRSPGKMKQFKDENGNILKNSISEKSFVQINGVKMGMFIKSKNRSNPVLLFVHGGPGMPEYFLTEKYPTGLENYFTIIWWDQRGAGLSYNSKIKADTMTSKQFVSDTIEVSKYLCKRFNQKKIYLMGHSWGTFIAIQAAAKAPELYNAYIGVAQITNTVKTEEMAYEYMLDYYKERGDEKTVNKLKNITVQSNKYFSIRDEVMHKAGIGTTRDMKSVIKGIFFPSLLFPEYTFREKINLWIGKNFSFKHTNLWQELNDMDISRMVTKLNIPVYFFSGVYDYTVCYKMAESYFRELSAPIKGFYLFGKSAHSPIFEEPEKVVEIIKKDILNRSNNLADER